jgi:hypothetical protein
MNVSRPFLALALLFASATDSISQPSPSPPPQQSRVPEGANYATIGRWSIRYRKIDNLSLCSAAVGFEDQTSLELLLVRSGSDTKAWATFITNPYWNYWISQKREHSLRLVTTRTWRANFAANGSNTLGTGGLSVDFMNSVANAASIEIFDGDKNLLTSLDMKDSAAAIRAVVNCVRDHPYAPAREPEIALSALSGMGFFFVTSHLITKNHVVDDCTKPIQVRYPERAFFPATIYSRDDTNDCAAQPLQKKERVGLSTDRFILSDDLPPTRLMFPGEVPVRVLKVTPSTGGQALHGYAKACPAQTVSNGKPPNCDSSAVWIFENP